MSVRSSPESYIIFVTEHDVMKKGLPSYSIERTILETGELFDDGTHILYINGEFRDDSDIGKLMHDFSCWNPDDMQLKEMKSVTRYYKQNPEGVEIMCREFEETREEGRKEGRKEGTLDTLSSLVSDGILSASQAAARAGMSVQDFIAETGTSISKNETPAQTF